MRVFQQYLRGKGELVTVGSLEEYWAALEQEIPDLVVLDLALAPGKASGIIADTRKKAPAARILTVAPSFSESEELTLLSLGVAGCCRAALPPPSIARILDMVEDGGVWISHVVLPLIMKQLREKSVADKQQEQAPRPVAKEDPVSSSSLTPREREIARLVGNGASNKVIARELNITDRTVKAHLSAIFQKLGVRDRLQLALYINSSVTS